MLSWKIDRGSCLVGDTVGLFCCFFSLPRDPFGDALCCRLSSELRRSDTDLGMLSGWWFVCLFVGEYPKVERGFRSWGRGGCALWAFCSSL